MREKGKISESLRTLGYMQRGGKWVALSCSFLVAGVLSGSTLLARKIEAYELAHDPKLSKVSEVVGNVRVDTEWICKNGWDCYVRAQYFTQERETLVIGDIPTHSQLSDEIQGISDGEIRELVIAMQNFFKKNAIDSKLSLQYHLPPGGHEMSDILGENDDLNAKRKDIALRRARSLIEKIGRIDPYLARHVQGVSGIVHQFTPDQMIRRSSNPESISYDFYRSMNRSS